MSRGEPPSFARRGPSREGSGTLSGFPKRRLFRAGALVGAAALAATPLACRRQKAQPAECLRLDVPREPVGFDAPFAITATMTCAELTGGHVAWKQLGGPVVAVSSARDGFELTGRMPALGPVPWGIVPLSARTRAEVVLQATWSDDRGRTLQREARVAAAHRSRGLPNTPVGVRVYLGGRGWHITERPAGSSAPITTGRNASLLPDMAGDWRLADSDGHTLALRTGRYDETPLDCGRSGCHAAITEAATATRMTSVLARFMDKRPAGADYPACALACHATGEPGAQDGGFSHTLTELGAAGDLTRRWEDLPRDLRRAGGVGCLACHGPGAIPETSARWSVLRADVCAVCHDAPPRYGHVVAWQQTAMARADQDPRARSDRACARCHTTWGFLEAFATPERKPVDRRPPDDVGLVGISCSACHAVHDPKRPGEQHLLRSTPAPALLAGAIENVCLPCHTPDGGDARPGASAAALWLGRGGLDPETGAALTGGAPHAAVAGGCIGCHRAGPENVERGGGHGFRAPASVCASCHPGRQPSSELRVRAQQLWRGISSEGDAGNAGPAHATPTAGVRADRRTPLGRAIWDLLLVLEDPAAEMHNPRYARALLDAAEPVIAAAATRKAR